MDWRFGAATVLLIALLPAPVASEPEIPEFNDVDRSEPEFLVIFNLDKARFDVFAQVYPGRVAPIGGDDPADYDVANNKGAYAYTSHRAFVAREPKRPEAAPDGHMDVRFVYPEQGEDMLLEALADFGLIDEGCAYDVPAYESTPLVRQVKGTSFRLFEGPVPAGDEFMGALEYCITI